MGIYFYQNAEREKRTQEKVKATVELRKKILNAQKNATPEGKEWTVNTKKDPASDKDIVRSVSIISNDDLCELIVQKRVDGSELTGLDCPGIKISEYDDIYVKFDIDETSRKMDIKTYTDSKDVYIPSYQYERSGYLPYKDFINGIITANGLAIKIPEKTQEFWTKFSLKGSVLSIDALGKEISLDPNSTNKTELSK
ncbi:MAG: hypothetical protein DHS20C13_27920 [Thermodesulfobacteriota bacterium]|nr:MAG: hypothetical protein DHS20C13_27920 [Thermodesulfobacteriota bacterium]